MSSSNVGQFNIGSNGWIEPGSRYGQGGGNPKSTAYSSDPGSFNSIPSAGTHMPLQSGMFGDAGFNITDFGGIWNGQTQSSIAAGTQGQPSGGFNTPYSTSGVPGSTMSSPFGDFSSLFTANGTQSLNPSSLFGGSSSLGVPGSGGGFPGLPQVNGHDLDKIYGKGVGQAIAQFLNSGAGFNQNVVRAEQNAAMPIEARGRENIMNAMGGHGLGTSSSAAIGLGDFETQFSSQLENLFAQQYEQSVSNYLNVLMGVKGDARANKAESGNWMQMLSSIADAAIPIFA